jgi:hypothetical protein
LITRRTFAALALLLPAAPALAAGADKGPAAPVIAIYKRVVASFDGKQNNADNGYFIWKDDKARRQYFSARTAKLWLDVDNSTAEGDEGPLGFDPVTNSQDPLVRAFDTSIEKQDAKSATVLVRISEKPGPITAPVQRELIRYDMVFENGRWVIDDIRGTIDTEWSIRKINLNFLDFCKEPDNVKYCEDARAEKRKKRR